MATTLHRHINPLALAVRGLRGLRARPFAGENPVILDQGGRLWMPSVPKKTTAKDLNMARAEISKLTSDLANAHAEISKLKAAQQPKTASQAFWRPSSFPEFCTPCTASQAKQKLRAIKPNEAFGLHRPVGYGW
eukprot:CAMPEP_0174727340 /NCGR_PEP_ID=MMETSP1094-20130205/49599_1 /TAXON_ID=156173 /ORGANISM="Chrysochromulina brevifilum, Strain UTEX LB 985" /LENGTH=133 /DNA_ID=CAMNT_0015929061 /DNA_START=77 /DNA_END=478 /DNA_ORIENTATION=+